MILRQSIKEKSLSLRNKCSQRVTSAAIAVASGGLGTTILTGAASAEGTVINVTQISGILADMGLIFPSFATLVVAIVPTIMTLAVIGFVLKFFDKILAMFDRLI